MVSIKYPIQEFIAAVQTELNRGLDPIPALETAMVTLSKGYLLQVDSVTVTGWPLGSMTASGKFREKIFVTRNGKTYLKHYQKPFNPRTGLQQTNRQKFKTAVAQWQRMTPEQREEWKILAVNEKLSGYNLFIQTAMKRK
jgi:transketolase